MRYSIIYAYCLLCTYFIAVCIKEILMSGPWRWWETAETAMSKMVHIN